MKKFTVKYLKFLSSNTYLPLELAVPIFVNKKELVGISKREQIKLVANYANKKLQKRFDRYNHGNVLNHYFFVGFSDA